MRIREILASASPHVAIQPALRLLIRRSRQLKREGNQVVVSGRAAVERFLEAQAPDGFSAGAFKSHLWHLVNPETEVQANEAALALNATILSVIGRPNTGDVEVHVQGGPSWLTINKMDAWLGTTQGRRTLSPRQAASWAHHLDGYRIGEQPLRIVTAETLPAVDRVDRNRTRQWSHQSWLPYSDEEGRYSATPEAIADMHAQLLRPHGLPVFDPFCGLGADSIAFARLGLQVFASEVDSARLELAKQNATALGVMERISFNQGDGIACLSRWADLYPDHGLYLDPPWGGKNWDRANTGLSDIFSDIEAIRAAVTRAQAVVIKLPRTFTTDDLSRLAPLWHFRLGIASTDDHIADQIRTICAHC